jgi:DNA internalization-related competence protein ComEC/Rec2
MTHVMHATRQSPQQGFHHDGVIVGDPGGLSQPSVRCATRSLLSPETIAVFAGSGMAVVFAVAAGAPVSMLLPCALLGVLIGAWRCSAVVGAAALGAVWICSALQSHQAADWDDVRRGERVLAAVQFPGLVNHSDTGWHADADLQVLNSLRPHEPVRRARIGASNTTLLAPRPGERWQLVLSLREPRAQLNPGAVDMERVYYAAGITALGTVRASPLNERMAPARGAWLARARQQLAEWVAAAGSDRDADALFLALAAGITAGFSPDDWRVFNATGTTHLIAISGTHVTGLAAMLYLLAAACWRLLASCGYRTARDHFAAALALLGAFAYALFAGFSVPTQRTLVMLCVWRLARGGARHVGALQTLALALLAVLMVDPFAPLSAGFWLSFGAMAVLLWQFQTSSAARRRPLLWLKDYVRSQWAVTWALAPLTAMIFGSVPIAGLWVNLLAIPVFTFLLVPLALCGSLLLWAWPAAGAWSLGVFTALHGLLATGLDAAAAGAWALWHLPEGGWQVLGLALAACCLLPLWPWQTRALALALCAALLAAGAARAVRDRPVAQLLALESGNGLAIIVRTRGHAVVVDTGDSWHSRGSAAAQKLVPALRALGVSAVDMLVLGPATADRGAGVAQLTKAMPVRELIAPPGWHAGPLALLPCAHRQWQWEAARLELHRAGEACALHVRVAGQGWWIVHTARPDDEIALAQVLRRRPLVGAAGRTQVLVLRRGAVRVGPNHPLWSLLRPQSVIAAGRGNGLKTPPAAQLWRTGEHGALRLAVFADGRAAWRSQRDDSSHWPWRRPGAEPGP